MEGKERLKKDRDRSRSAGGRLKKKKATELTYESCFGIYKMSRSFHPPASILRVYIEDLSDFNHTTQMLSTTSCYLKAASLKQLRVWEWWAQYTFQEQRRDKEPVIA